MVGDQAGSQVEFFRLATKLGFLERFGPRELESSSCRLERRM